MILSYKEFNDQRSLQNNNSNTKWLQDAKRRAEMTDCVKEPDSNYQTLRTGFCLVPVPMPANLPFSTRKLSEKRCQIRSSLPSRIGFSMESSKRNGTFQAARWWIKPLRPWFTDLLKQRGLAGWNNWLIWGGEFGRTNSLSRKKILALIITGRDHHSSRFSLLWDGGRWSQVRNSAMVKPDELRLQPLAEHPVHVHDFRLQSWTWLGIAMSEWLISIFGRRYDLTDVFW